MDTNNGSPDKHESEVARDIANICATGYERHIHGPGSSHVVARLETMVGGAFIVERDGWQFAVTVSRQTASGPLQYAAGEAGR